MLGEMAYASFWTREPARRSLRQREHRARRIDQLPLSLENLADERASRVVNVLMAANSVLRGISTEFGGKAGDALLDRAASGLPSQARHAIGLRLARHILFRQPVVYAIGGYSVTVGRGVLAMESWPAVLEQWLRPVFAAGNTAFNVQNLASGGTPSFPLGWCMPEVFGPSPTLVSWQFSMNEPGNRCNLASEYYTRKAIELPSQPLLLIVDENARRSRSLTETYAAFGAHGINIRAALPTNLSEILPWGLSIDALMTQEMAPGCEAAKFHPGWRHHRLVAAAVARLHLLQLKQALSVLPIQHLALQQNGTTIPLPHPKCVGPLGPSVQRLRRSTCEAVPTVAPPVSFVACRLLTEPRHEHALSDLMALVHGPVLVADGRLKDHPPANSPWPPSGWIVMLNPHDIKPTHTSQRCGSNYQDRKYTMVGSASAGWLRLRLPYPQPTRESWPRHYSTVKFCKGGKVAFDRDSPQMPLPPSWQGASSVLHGSVTRYGSVMICSSPGVPKPGLGEADFGGLLHQPLAGPGTQLEWQLNGEPATPVVVYDERDPNLAVYLEHPLCIVFALPPANEGITFLQVGVRVLKTGVYATISHVLWS